MHLFIQKWGNYCIYNNFCYSSMDRYIFFHLSNSGSRIARTYPSCHRVRGRVYPGQAANLVIVIFIITTSYLLICIFSLIIFFLDLLKHSLSFCSYALNISKSHILISSWSSLFSNLSCFRKYYPICAVFTNVLLFLKTKIKKRNIITEIISKCNVSSV